VDLHVHLVRPALPNGQRLVAEATAVHVGSTMATAEGRVTDSAGKLIAHGTGTFAIVDVAR
ncbi:MAG TPA: PaaI family thioesterase, partial [Candidatus Aquilonibacter sp.]